MGCVVAIIGLAVPRVALVALWLFSDRLIVAFESFIVGALGFLLLPTTTLMWAVAYSPTHGMRGFGWILVGLGLALDLSTHGASGRRLRSRARR